MENNFINTCRTFKNIYTCAKNKKNHNKKNKNFILQNIAYSFFDLAYFGAYAIQRGIIGLDYIENKQTNKKYSNLTKPYAYSGICGAYRSIRHIVKRDKNPKEHLLNLITLIPDSFVNILAGTFCLLIGLVIAIPTAVCLLSIKTFNFLINSNKNNNITK